MDQAVRQALRDLHPTLYAEDALDPAILYLEPLTRAEGAKAVLARAASGPYALSEMKAEGISAALGDDPLLIGLQDLAREPRPENTIGAFVEDALQRAQAAIGEPSAALREGLRNLAREMLQHRRLEPSWSDISGWTLDANTRDLIKALARDQALLGFHGPSTDLKLQFRHDRIRDWILAEAVQGADDLDIEADPFFAEIVGDAVVRRGAPIDRLTRLQQANPLGLFFSLKLAKPGVERQRVVDALGQWLADPCHRTNAFAHLRWEALAVLSQIDGQDIPTLVRLFPDHSPSSWIARMRNGDLNGGFEMCATFDLSMTDPGRDQAVAHAKLKYGNSLISAMDEILRRPGVEGAALAGVLRVAGFIGDTRLVPALRASWTDRPAEQLARLPDYLWALSRCVDAASAEAALAPICDLWASLPEDDPSDATGTSGLGVSRSSIMAYSPGFAFARQAPENALHYLVMRAELDKRLTWPITYMLRTVDHPKAVAFVASEIAKTIRKNGWAVSADFIESDWQRAQANGRPMSPASRAALLTLWRDPANDVPLRSASLSLWSATKEEADLGVLTEVANEPDLKLSILRDRLERNDHRAIPDLLDLLQDSKRQHLWWPLTRYVWCSALTDAFDEYLERRKYNAPDDQDAAQEDVSWQTVAVLCRMEVADAERLLRKHWSFLKAYSAFVHAALYVGTPRLLALADQAVKASTDPFALFHQLGLNYGLQIQPHPGVVREDQVLHLEPYLSFLPTHTIVSLAHVCNEHGWFETRRRLLDGHFDNQRECWQITHASDYFDKILDRERASWIYHEVDDALRTGLAWALLRDALLAWLTKRRTMEALRIAWTAMAHRGLRSDLAMLSLEPWMDQAEASHLLTDVDYAIRRRSAL